MKWAIGAALAAGLVAGAAAADSPRDELIARIKADILALDTSAKLPRLSQKQQESITLGTLRALEDYTYIGDTSTYLNVDKYWDKTLVGISKTCWTNSYAINSMDQFLYCVAYDLNIASLILIDEASPEEQLHFNTVDLFRRLNSVLSRTGTYGEPAGYISATIRQMYIDMVVQLEALNNEQ